MSISLSLKNDIKGRREVGRGTREAIKHHHLMIHKNNQLKPVLMKTMKRTHQSLYPSKETFISTTEEQGMINRKRFVTIP